MAKRLNVLIVDDDDIDVMAIKRSLKNKPFVESVVRAKDGIEALEILKGDAAKQAELKPPYIVLMDINMPRMNGIECVQTIRQDPTLRSAVVFFMSTSTDEKDMKAAYDCAIAGYLVKSQLGKRFTKITDLIEKYADAVALDYE